MFASTYRGRWRDRRDVRAARRRRSWWAESASKTCTSVWTMPSSTTVLRSSPTATTRRPPRTDEVTVTGLRATGSALWTDHRRQTPLLGASREVSEWHCLTDAAAAGRSDAGARCCCSPQLVAGFSKLATGSLLAKAARPPSLSQVEVNGIPICKYRGMRNDGILRMSCFVLPQRHF